MSQPRLEYDYSVPKTTPYGEEVETLRKRVSVLEHEVSIASASAKSFRHDLEKAHAIIANLRKGFDPVYGALKRLYGEMDEVSSVGGGPAGGKEYSASLVYWQ